MPNIKKAIIKLVNRGRQKGQFRFVLKAENGEVIATSGTETYTQKHNIISVLKDHFPDFQIFDATIKR